MIHALLLSASLSSCALPPTPPQVQLSSPDSVEDAPDSLGLRLTPEVIVAQEARPAVVYVETDVTTMLGYDLFGRPVQRQGKSGGSGVVIFDEGYVVTNYHVVEGAEKIRVRFDEQLDPEVYPARLISEDRAEDLALLKIDADHPFDTVTLGRSDDLMIAEPVIAIGNPYGQSFTVSRGIISGLHRDVDVGNLQFEGLIQTDASINPGNSGGPLLNINGELIGINTVMNSVAENIGFAIPVDRLRGVLFESLLASSEAKAWFGLRPETDDDGRLRIASVLPNSPAALAGIRASDELVAIQGREVPDMDAYQRTWLSLEAGERTNFTLLRDGRRLEFQLDPWAGSDGVLYERLGVRLEPQLFMQGNKRFWMLRVTDVLEGGPGDELKLQRDDLVSALLAPERLVMEPQSAIDVALYLREVPPNASVDLNVWRDKNENGRLEYTGELLKGSLTVR